MTCYQQDHKMKDEKRDHCCCQCTRRCSFFPFPTPRDASCQSLVSIANTVLGLPGDAALTFTTTTTTTTVSGTYLGFNTATGSIIVANDAGIRSFRLSEICTIGAGGL
ncbi:hypothetical protein [Bacillus sp. Marseille-P3800]|uniref:hypothetical protein n=1 Tax=Bacillus sp. Marseille-P3800 TaxID=2014782 RepID=UPI000C07BDC0|nr:hypothetical protein [Bacillus sp. Marseille-P3800]